MVLDLLSLDLETQTSLLSNIGLYSYGTALLAYIMLVILAIITRRNHSLGKPVLAASALTVLWAGVITVATLVSYPPILLIQFAELARNGAWIYVLLRFIGLRLKGTDR